MHKSPHWQRPMASYRPRTNCREIAMVSTPLSMSEYVAHLENSLPLQCLHPICSTVGDRPRAEQEMKQETMLSMSWRPQSHSSGLYSGKVRKEEQTDFKLDHINFNNLKWTWGLGICYATGRELRWGRAKRSIRKNNDYFIWNPTELRPPSLDGLVYSCLVAEMIWELSQESFPPNVWTFLAHFSISLSNPTPSHPIVISKKDCVLHMS